MRGDVEVYDVSSIMAQDDEGEEDSERRRRDGEEVDRYDVASMIVEKGPPRW